MIDELNEGEIVQADMQAVRENLAEPMWDRYDDTLYKITEINDNGELKMESIDADLHHVQGWDVNSVKRLYNKVDED
jgi:hypothetical protein